MTGESRRSPLEVSVFHAIIQVSSLKARVLKTDSGKEVAWLRSNLWETEW